MNKSQALFKRDTNCLSDVMKLRFYPFVAERGEGAVLYDVDGKKYLDFNAGWGVANTGYNHPRIVKAVCDLSGIFIERYFPNNFESLLSF